MRTLFLQVGHVFGQPALLRQALTHCSVPRFTLPKQIKLSRILNMLLPRAGGPRVWSAGAAARGADALQRARAALLPAAGGAGRRHPGLAGQHTRVVRAPAQPAGCAAAVFACISMWHMALFMYCASLKLVASTRHALGGLPHSLPGEPVCWLFTIELFS